METLLDRRRLIQRGLAVIAGLDAVAAGATRSPRILMITFRGETDVERGFRAYLANNNVIAEIHSVDCNRNVANVPAILRAAVDFQPDLIYTWGTGVTLAVTGTYDVPATHALTGVPVVFSLVAAPVQAHIVPSLSGHGRNLTGAVHVVPTEVQMRAMKSYKPFSKVGVLYSSTEQNSKAIVAEMRELGKRANYEVVERTFTLDSNGKPTANGAEQLVSEIRSEGADWLYLLPDTFLGSVYNRVTPAALKEKLPTFGAAELAVRSGGALVGLVSRYNSIGQLAAAKAVDILVHGKPASSLQIETLKRFSLIVNIGLARALGGVYPPIEMLNYAEVINTDAAGALRRE